MSTYGTLQYAVDEDNVFAYMQRDCLSSFLVRSGQRVAACCSRRGEKTNFAGRHRLLRRIFSLPVPAFVVVLAAATLPQEQNAKKGEAKGIGTRTSVSLMPQHKTIAVTY